MNIYIENVLTENKNIPSILRTKRCADRIEKANFMCFGNRDTFSPQILCIDQSIVFWSSTWSLGRRLCLTKNHTYILCESVTLVQTASSRMDNIRGEETNEPCEGV